MSNLLMGCNACEHAYVGAEPLEGLPTSVLRRCSLVLCVCPCLGSWRRGTYSVGERAARTGRNPRTREPIEIPASKVVKFRPGSALKTAVNG